VRLTLLLVALAAAGCTTADPIATATPASAPIAAAIPASAKRLPQIDLVTFDNAPARLESLAAGKPALVTLWATWCESCVAEFDALKRLDARAKEAGAMVIGIDVGEPRQTAAEFARRHALSYPQLSDEEFKLADALGQKRVPATIVLDREGRVVFVGGALDEKALAAFRGVMAR
jgi:peroxiredoxin